MAPQELLSILDSMKSREIEGTIKTLSGEKVIVIQGVFIWNKEDYRKYLKGKLVTIPDEREETNNETSPT